MCALGWEVGGEAWSWRRILWAWEEELIVECSHLVNNVVLQTDVLERWQWDPDIDGGYTVSGAYHILTAQNRPSKSGCGHDESASHLILHCDIFDSLWQNVRSWIGVSGVEPYDICDHFFKFTHHIGSSKKRTSFLQLIWLLCV
ncbi:hypothetical protein MTR_5g038480 [Medicago truncatula]|uniref:Reverse transcriptase zinc-binding domain-containing protein n=1 Tax=Medicago truncatula TaxID=3880 RepID=G7K9T1_MEDTR|nr:hypothetical protein MTR_5g038480 [Medicago truncatula]